MKRAMIRYGGDEFVLGEDPAAVLRKVEEIARSGFGWLEVGFGRGELRPTHLLIAPGVPIAVVDANDPADSGTSEPRHRGTEALAVPPAELPSVPPPERTDAPRRPADGVAW